MEHLCAHADTLFEAASAYRTNHEFLEADRSVRVSATVDDVHHRNRENICVATADIAIERHVEIVGSSLGNSERNAEDSVSAEVRLSRSAVKGKHNVVYANLVKSAMAYKSVGNRAVYICNCLLHAFAHIAALVAVTEFESLVLACGCTGGNSCTTHNAAFKNYVNFYCRIATRVKNLATDNLFNFHVLI